MSHKNNWVEFSDREMALLEALYAHGTSAREIAEVVGTDHKTVLRRLRARDATILTHSQRAKQRIEGIDEAVIALYQDSSMTISEIAKVFSTSRSNIKAILTNADVPLRTHKGQVTYTVNETFFDDIDCEAKAYWLGFVYADGHVGDHGLQFRVLKADRIHLEMLKESLGSNHPIKSWTPNTVSISIKRVHISRTLRKLGLKSDKSDNLPWPPIATSLERHFIRGFMDGDGNLFHSQNPEVFKFTLYSNCELFLLKVQQILMRECQLNKTKLHARRRECGGFVLQYGGRLQVKRIFDYLYDGATVWLPRKRDKIEPYL